MPVVVVVGGLKPGSARQRQPARSSAAGRPKTAGCTASRVRTDAYTTFTAACARARSPPGACCRGGLPQRANALNDDPAPASKKSKFEEEEMHGVASCYQLLNSCCNSQLNRYSFYSPSPPAARLGDSEEHRRRKRRRNSPPASHQNPSLYYAQRQAPSQSDCYFVVCMKTEKNNVESYTREAGHSARRPATIIVRVAEDWRSSAADRQGCSTT